MVYFASVVIAFAIEQQIATSGHNRFSKNTQTAHVYHRGKNEFVIDTNSKQRSRYG